MIPSLFSRIYRLADQFINGVKHLVHCHGLKALKAFFAVVGKAYIAAHILMQRDIVLTAGLPSVRA